MPRPDLDLDLLAQATSRLLATVEGLGDLDMQSPSLLSGWSVGHLLTHLARNADSHSRRLQAAAEGRLVPQYEGGRLARDAAIEEGARRAPEEIKADLVAACEQLDRVLAAVPDPAWDSEVEREHFRAPAWSLPFTRVMEVEVHHVDLGRSYGPADWQPAFVDRALPEVMERLARNHAGVAGPPSSWHVHRTDGSGEWTVRRSPDGTTLTTEHAKGDFAIRGPGASLLAWLLGRHSASSAGLELFGDAESAASLPTVYPYG